MSFATMDPDALTILVPCRKPHPGYFRDAVQSVLCQTMPHWRLVVIHDPDDMEFNQVWRDMDLKDKRVEAIASTGARLTGALNTGCRHAKSSFVALLLADDRLDVSAVEVLNRCISENPDIDFFYSARRYIDDEGQYISSVYPPRSFKSPKDFIDSSPVKHLLCWRRERAIQAGGFDPDLGLHAADDYDFPWTMAEAGLRFMPVPECLYHYRDHRSHFRLTTGVPLEVQVGELRKIFTKHGLSREEIENQIAVRTTKHLRQAGGSDDWREEYK